MYTIQKASVADIELLHRLGYEAFSATYRELLSKEQIDFMLDWMYSPTNLHKQIEEENHTFFILRDRDEPAGYVSVSPEKNEKGGYEKHIYHLHKLYLLPRFQGKGYGHIMFAHAVEYVRSVLPCSGAIRLNVNRYNTKAVRFYEKHGMKKIFEGDFDIGFGYLMTDYIMELVIEKTEDKK